MSESEGIPKGFIRRAIDKRKLQFSINFRSDYDRYINPVDYDEHMRSRTRERLGREVARVLVDHLPPQNGNGKQAKVLDLAAGTGIISEALQRQGYEVVATDMSTKAIDYLKQHIPGIEALQADMNKPLPLPNEDFDGATIVWGNRYIKNPQAFLQEIYRVLKPGGIFTWPIFPAEQFQWKMRNAGTLAKSAEQVGFNVENKIGFYSTFRRSHLPLIHSPTFLILRK